jgi:hypothetical protein
MQYSIEEVKLCFDYIQRNGICVKVEENEIFKIKSLIILENGILYRGNLRDYASNRYWAYYDNEIKAYVVAYKIDGGIAIYTTNKNSLFCHMNKEKSDIAIENSLFKNLLRLAKENKRVIKVIRQ